MSGSDKPVIGNLQNHVDEFNKNERKTYRSQKVKDVINGIKGAIIPDYEEKLLRKVEAATLGLKNQRAYEAYLERQSGYYLEGRVRKETLVDGSQMTTVYAKHGAIEKTEHLLSEEDVNNRLTSKTTYEGFSLVDINCNGKNQLVYSSITVAEGPDVLKLNVSGAIRDAKGNFTNFEYPAYSTADMHHWKLGLDVQLRYNSLERTFNECLEEFSSNPENIIDLTMPAEDDEQFSQNEETSSSDKVETAEEAKPSSFFGKIKDKVEDFVFGYGSVPDGPY